MATNLATSKREFVLTSHNFATIAKLVRQRTGIVLTDQKFDMVYSRLSRRLRDQNLTSFDGYLALLASPQGADEIGVMINSITTNLTRFFREPHHFHHLKDHGLPEAQTRAKDKRLRIWSAGCSTGEEPYSIAATAVRAIPDLANWDLKVLATDIDTQVLETARAAEYRASDISRIEGGLGDGLFRKSANPARSMIAPKFRALVHFRPLNLLEKWPMTRKFDIIFCRNVLIYFDVETRKRIVSRFSRYMPSGGYLYLGHSESLLADSVDFEPLGQTIFRRR